MANGSDYSDHQNGTTATGNEYGVLLYYQFVDISEPHSMLEWFQSICSSQSLLGRVRIAHNGVNVTVGGSMASLRVHIKSVAAHPSFKDCDFKLATCSQPFSNKISAECGFSCLSIRVVKEIVTLGLDKMKSSPSILFAGKHLSPQDFHNVLLESSNAIGDESRLKPEKDVVVLDARNIYETRIGKFCPSYGVELLDPKVRQYSDFPGWIDANVERLRNKKILMYCTGGVRCELASAYIRSKGDEFNDVFQLSGGIQRYLEAFPDGGFFTGKNFVFDHRIAVGTSKDEVIGTCLLCRVKFDDYSYRCRCSLCRMLVLVCPACQDLKLKDTAYVCELCQSRGSQGTRQNEEILANPEDCSNGNSTKKKLKILCLHGFRQNASNFKGRMSSLRRKLKHIVDFVYVDAPHVLPFVYQIDSEDTASEVKLPEVWNKKFAWLVSSEASCPEEGVTLSLEDGTEDMHMRSARQPFNPLQYQSQDAGWARTLEYLQEVFSKMGPFDGVLGFSQGAAIATCLSYMRCKMQSVNFKFAIICSGFVPPILDQEEFKCFSNPENLLTCPSLHIFCGNGGDDRQIGVAESIKLASLFSSASRVIIQHNSGHMIPTQPEYVQQYTHFLTQFLQTSEDLI